MVYNHNYIQPNLLGFSSFGFHIEDTELVKLSQQVNWDELITIVSKVYSSQTGRNSKSIRTMIALEMLKVYYKNPSDEMVVNLLKTDAAVMYFCGYDAPPTKKDIPDSSSMTKFRNRLTKQILTEITNALVRLQMKKLHPKKRRQVSGDTTALPANITYPTDTKLLFRAGEKLRKIAKQTGVAIIAGWKQVEKSYGKYRKTKKRVKKQIETVRKKLLDYGKKQIEKIGEKFAELNIKQGELVANISEVLRQQEKMLTEGINKVKERIVSIHEPEIRPIFRGKAGGKKTEFGKKLAIMVIGQKLIVPTKCEYEAFADQNCVKTDVERYKQITGNEPQEYSYDRGGHSPDNHELMKKNKITDGIGYRGKSPPKTHQQIPKATAKRIYGQRQSAEMRIGVLKTRYGCGRIPYKSENTDVRVTFGCMMSNLLAVM